MAERPTDSARPSAPIFDCIGDTPLVEIEHASEQCSATIYGKLEYFNPTSSLKDRIYHEMITGAIERGDLEPGMEILECSTGNAGIACTFVGTRLGYDVTIVMPEGMSEERKKVIRAFGGDLVDDRIEGHVVIAGYGRVGETIASVLDRQHIRYLAIERDVALGLADEVWVAPEATDERG